MKWEKLSKTEMKKKLTSEQFSVTQEEATEPPFKNEFWNHHEEGLYVDIVSGEPLFSSQDKFDSGCGWPSFSKPLSDVKLTEKSDRKLWQERTEVRSPLADSHLGHVFNDGPGPTGLRYCINSAALKFIPVSELKAKGYGEYEKLFTKSNAKENQVSVEKFERALLAGGCFWGMQDLIRALKGVQETHVGYTGGFTPNPKYEQVKTGTTGHAEAIEVVFDPKVISYEEILKFFFKIHDPTTLNQQGNDRGTQYRSAIFVQSQKQKEVATKVLADVEKSHFWKKPIVTEVVQAGPFYLAEDYHQDYLKKNPGGYTCHYIRK